MKAMLATLSRRFKNFLDDKVLRLDTPFRVFMELTL